MKKRAIVAIISCVLVCAAAVGIYFGATAATKEPSVVYGHAQYVIDIDDPREVSGFVDFVFVGRVEKKNEVKYEYLSATGDDYGLPFTNYDITILENIKGNLRVNETISLWKQGGIMKDGKSIQVLEGDFLPEIGDVCMFYATADKEGSLVANQNVKLLDSKLTEESVPKMSPALVQQAAQNELNSVAQSPLYQELVEACENEIPYQRERFTAPAALLEAPAE